ncbi:MAG: PDDEXK nuclease domain-containing protein [Ruminococcus sp.]
MKELTASYQADKLEFIKNPVIAEFLGLSSNTDFTESELEQRIITHIQKFLMELGKGYAFVARQQHIRTEKEDYYIDLVFYNYILKCFVLIGFKNVGNYNIPIAPSLYSLSNKMDNSLLAVRVINHKYIVVERSFLYNLNIRNSEKEG